MVEKKASTPERESKRRYEEKHKAKRKETSGNFQTMIPKAEYEEITAFLKEHHITKVQFIRTAYEYIKTEYHN